MKKNGFVENNNNRVKREDEEEKWGKTHHVRMIPNKQKIEKQPKVDSIVSEPAPEGLSVEKETKKWEKESYRFDTSPGDSNGRGGRRQRNGHR